MAREIPGANGEVDSSLSLALDPLFHLVIGIGIGIGIGIVVVDL